MPAAEEMKTTWPRSRASIPGTSRWVSSSGAVRLTSTIEVSSSRVYEVKALAISTPAAAVLFAHQAMNTLVCSRRAKAATTVASATSNTTVSTVRTPIRLSVPMAVADQTSRRPARPGLAEGVQSRCITIEARTGPVHASRKAAGSASNIPMLRALVADPALAAKRYADVLREYLRSEAIATSRVIRCITRGRASSVGARTAG